MPMFFVVINSIWYNLTGFLLLKKANG